MAKEEEEGAKKLSSKKDVPSLSATTLFVRNLPFVFDSKELEKVFSDVGPVKRCFVVKDTGDPGKCKGFGYVTFALKEDALQAKEKIREINGRKVFVTFSKKKPRHIPRGPTQEQQADMKPGTAKENEKTESVDGEITTEAPSQLLTKEKPKRKPKSQRSSAVNDDGRTIVLSGFPSTFKIKQLKKACKRHGEVERFVYPVENEAQPTAHAIYKLHKNARKAVTNLDKKTIKGVVVSAALRSKQNKTVSQKSLKKTRLIVRNLPFKCSRDLLQDSFSKFGEITEIVLPTKMTGKNKVKLGFAFVQFKNIFEAADAMENMNGKHIKGRPIAVDWTVPKKKYELLKVTEDPYENGDDENGKGISEKAGDDHIGVDDMNDQTDDEANMDDDDIDDNGLDDHNEEDDEDDDDVDDDDVDEDGNDDIHDDVDIGSIDDDDETDGDNEDEMADKTPGKKKSKLRDAREGKTIFIRNLPFDASKEEVSGLFEEFGEVDYCKIVMDGVTEHSRGSAFLKFKEKEDAARCLEKYGEENEHSEDLIMRKRPLSVTLAVTKGKIPQLLAKKDDKKKVPGDKRNLYLAKEGVIVPGSEAAAVLSKSDMQKRRKAEEEKKAKLKMPHYVVSKTRLCFRNIPLHIDDTKLSEVLRNVCEGKPKTVRKVKIMRNMERLDSAGNARSKGFGFAEFLNHQDALEVLRATNNNPAVFGADRRPIVEFAIENGLVLKRLEQRKSRNLRKAKEKESTVVQNSKPGKNKRKHEMQGNTQRKRAKKERGSNESVDNQKVLNFEGFSNELKHTISGNNPNVTNNKGMNVAKESKYKKRNKKKSNELASDKLKILRPKTEKTSRRKNVDKEEENFNSIVQKYKTKLFGENSKRLKNSRWFNV